MMHAGLLSLNICGVSSLDHQVALIPAKNLSERTRQGFPDAPCQEIRPRRDRSCVQFVEFWRVAFALACLALLAMKAIGQTPHSIQISNDADDGYYDVAGGNGWISSPGSGGADLVGSNSTNADAWVIGYRFPTVGVNSGDTIRSAYLEVVSSDGSATSTTCGSAPCPNSGTAFRIYGVAQDNGNSFSGAPGNTPLDVPYTTSYDAYITTGPGDVHGSCQGNNNGQNTCIHIIDVTNIVQEITSRPGWTSSSAMRFVLLRTATTSSNTYAGFEDSSANSARAATLVINPDLPTIISSGGWGTSPTLSYPVSYQVGPFVYSAGTPSGGSATEASTLLLFLGDYYNFYSEAVTPPSVSDNCGNTWNILAGPTNFAGAAYFQRGTLFYVENPLACPAGDTLTISIGAPAPSEPIFLHFLAVTGSNSSQAPITSAITNPGTPTTASGTTASITLSGAGLLANWIFGDSDSPEFFAPQSGFSTDLNSTPTYITADTESVSSAGSYQESFTITPNPDGWQTILVGIPSQIGTPTVTVSPGVSTIKTNQSLSVTVTVTGNPTPTGSVTLSDGSGYTSSAATLTSGSASITVPSGTLAVGNYTFQATYTPDTASSGIYNSATGSALTQVTVSTSAPTVTVTPNPTSINTVQAVNVTVAVSGGTGNPTPTGTVTVSGPALPSGTYTSAATTLSAGSAIINVPAGSLAAGTDTLTATYTPDTNGSGYYSSGTGTNPLVVSKDAPTVTVTPGASNINATQALSVTVAVSGGAGNPTATGTVVLSGGNYTSAVATLSSGSATINIPAGTLGNGTYTFTAAYTPDTNSSPVYANASGTAATSVTVGLSAPTVTVTPGTNAISIGQPLVVTVMVAGTPAPTGSVTLTGGNYSTPSATTLNSGTATITIPANALIPGIYTFKANYSPDSGSSSTYTAASGTAATTVAVNAAPTVTVTPGASSVGTAQALAVTVAVSGGAGTPVPTGSVILSSGTYASAASTLTGGTVTISIPANTLTAASYTFKAVYTPDSNSAPIYLTASGTATASVNVVTPTYSMSATNPSAINKGGTATSTVTVSSATGFSGTVTLSCTVAGPSGASDSPTCTGGTVNFPANTQASITVTTTAATAELVRPALGTGKGWAGSGGAVLAVVLFFWLPIRQKKWRAMLGVLFGLVLFSSLTACGGGGGNSSSSQQTNPGTTSGNYTITVTGTGSVATTFTLTVN
jgi:hypothetical protein